ncbi:MAG: hypothetical protein HY426_00535 [Candidatus Levybacteria bacterium]|nr:hypothetical protein [Candidatus Levybacteria bacterium]
MSGQEQEGERLIPGPLGGASDEACSAIEGPVSFAAFKNPSALRREWARQTRPIGEYQPYAVPGITTPKRLEHGKAVQVPSSVPQIGSAPKPAGSA